MSGRARRDGYAMSALTYLLLIAIGAALGFYFAAQILQALK